MRTQQPIININKLKRKEKTIAKPHTTANNKQQRDKKARYNVPNKINFYHDHFLTYQSNTYFLNTDK
jgi:hypothetical protein